MAKFGHPDQYDSMMLGVRAAMTSANTPAHLKPHLEKRLQGETTMAMNINPAHRGLFTKKAKAAGMGVQAYANKEAAAGGVLGKEANFARMAKRHFKPLPASQKKSRKPKANPFYE